MNAGAAASPHVGPAVSHVPDGCPHKIQPLAQGSQELGRGKRASPQGDPKTLGARRLCGHKLRMSSSVRKQDGGSILEAESRGCGARPCATLWGGTTPVPSWRGHPEPTPAWRPLPVSLAPAQKRRQKKTLQPPGAVIAVLTSL